LEHQQRHKGLKAFDAIWGNTGFRNSLFIQPLGSTIAQWKIQAEIDFLSYVNGLNNNIFGFIKSR
jgi:hypothetical protein